MTTTYQIVRDGYFFRAVINGRKSQVFTSASQAGRYIEIKAGKDAHAEAAAEFMAR